MPYPIYRMNEPRNTPSPCTTRFMTTEEIERLGATRVKPPTNFDGKEIQPPHNFLKGGVNKRFMLTKQQYLERRAAGKTRKQIAISQGILVSTLETNWLRVWGIRNPELEELAIQEINKL